MSEPKRSGTKVTSVDLDTGETQVIHNDVCVIVDGTAYVGGVQDFRKSGTQVWTIKGRLGRSRS